MHKGLRDANLVSVHVGPLRTSEYLQLIRAGEQNTLIDQQGEKRTQHFASYYPLLMKVAKCAESTFQYTFQGKTLAHLNFFWQHSNINLYFTVRNSILKHAFMTSAKKDAQ